MQTSVHLKVFQNKKFIFKKHVINIGPKTDQKIPHFMAPILSLLTGVILLPSYH